MKNIKIIIKECMMNANKEIGSEFYYAFDKKQSIAKENITSILNNYNYQFYQSGRIASLKALEFIKTKKILMPNYVCESVLQPFKSQKFDIVFYQINEDFSIDDSILSLINTNFGAVYIIPYYGLSYDYSKIKDKCKQHKVLIIEDTTQSIFTNVSQVGDLMVCSLRKWFAVAEGGLFYTKLQFKEDNEINWKFVDKRLNMLQMKHRYLNGESNNY